MDNAAFMTNEDGDDLIVSFAIPIDEFGDVKSLTLLRTPKFESFLDEAERGVRISSEDFPDDDTELLERITVKGDLVTIKSTSRTYTVSIASVEADEIEGAKKVLRKMNFDERFELEFIERFAPPS